MQQRLRVGAALAILALAAGVFLLRAPRERAPEESTSAPPAAAPSLQAQPGEAPAGAIAPPALDALYPLGVIFASGERRFEGALRWPLFAVSDQISFRFPEALFEMTIGQPSSQAYYLYCFGKILHEDPALPRSDPRTECSPLEGLDHSALPELLGAEDGLAPIGWANFEGHNAEYYDSAKFANGRAVVLKGAGPELVARATLVFQYADASRAPAVRIATYAFLLVPVAPDALAKPLLGAGVPGRGCHDAMRHLEAFYRELASPRYQVASLDDLGGFSGRKIDRNKVVVFLRHDLDKSIYGARQVAQLEQSLGLRSTYFVNMASGFSGVLADGAYLPNPALAKNLERLNAAGHEIGFHNDLVVFNLVFGLPMREWAEFEIGRLREQGFRIDAASPNGSPLAYRLSTDNVFAFNEFREGGLYDYYADTRADGGRKGYVTFDLDGARRTVSLADLSLADLGLKADAKALVQYSRKLRLELSEISDVNTQRSDFTAKLQSMAPGTLVSVLIHPCDWTLCNFEGDVVVSPEHKRYVSAPDTAVLLPTFGAALAAAQTQ